MIDDKDDSDIAVLIEETGDSSETGQVHERNAAEVSDVRNMANKLEINKMLPQESLAAKSHGAKA